MCSPCAHVFYIILLYTHCDITCTVLCVYVLLMCVCGVVCVWCVVCGVGVGDVCLGTLVCGGRNQKIQLQQCYIYIIV